MDYFILLRMAFDGHNNHESVFSCEAQPQKAKKIVKEQTYTQKSLHSVSLLAHPPILTLPSHFSNVPSDRSLS